jgi:hypothetical protein
MVALGTRLLTLDIDGTPFTAQVSNVRITSSAADSDFVSFADAANGGGRLYKLAMTAVQDPATGTLWDLVWTSVGDTVPFTLMPAGGSVTPTEAQPHFVGNAVVAEPDGDLLGGEANASTTSKFTFEVEWECTAKPVRVTS